MLWLYLCSYCLSPTRDNSAFLSLWYLRWQIGCLIWADIIPGEIKGPVWLFVITLVVGYCLVELMRCYIWQEEEKEICCFRVESQKVVGPMGIHIHLHTCGIRAANCLTTRVRLSPSTINGLMVLQLIWFLGHFSCVTASNSGFSKTYVYQWLLHLNVKCWCFTVIF